MRITKKHPLLTKKILDEKQSKWSRRLQRWLHKPITQVKRRQQLTLLNSIVLKSSWQMRGRGLNWR